MTPVFDPEFKNAFRALERGEENWNESDEESHSFVAGLFAIYKRLLPTPKLFIHFLRTYTSPDDINLDDIVRIWINVLEGTTLFRCGDPAWVGEFQFAIYWVTHDNTEIDVTQLDDDHLEALWQSLLFLKKEKQGYHTGLFKRVRKETRRRDRVAKRQ